MDEKETRFISNLLKTYGKIHIYELMGMFKERFDFCPTAVDLARLKIANNYVKGFCVYSDDQKIKKRAEKMDEVRQKYLVLREV